jgi:peroxiredoxin Q/BCP
MLKVPTIEISSTLNRSINLADYKGMNVLIYFYPKDSFPVCIEAAEDFRNSSSKFAELNCAVFGISRDSIESHLSFKNKLNLPFELLSDRDERLCKHFDVIQQKKWRDITYDSILRCTFLINVRGEVIKEWRDVNREGHIASILHELRNLEDQQYNKDIPLRSNMPTRLKPIIPLTHIEHRGDNRL